MPLRHIAAMFDDAVIAIDAAAATLSTPRCHYFDAAADAAIDAAMVAEALIAAAMKALLPRLTPLPPRLC